MYGGTYICTGDGENDIIEGWGGEIEKREKKFSKRWLILGFLVFNCSILERMMM